MAKVRESKNMMLITPKTSEATTNGTVPAGETNPADADEQDKVGAAR